MFHVGGLVILIGKKRKTCHEGKNFSCNACVLNKIPDTITKMRQNELCKDICNHVSYTGCRFFPFTMVTRKKNFNEQALKKASKIGRF